MKRTRIGLRVVGVFVAVGALAACFGPTSPPLDDAPVGDGGPAVPDFSRLDVQELSGTGHEVLNGNRSYTAYTNALGTLLWAADLHPVLVDWSTDKPSSYGYPASQPFYDVEWTQDGSTFTWQITDGELNYTVTVEDSGNGFSVTVTESSTTLLFGTFAYDGSEGDVELRDYDGRTATYAWGASDDPDYDIRIDITWSDPQQTFDDTMTIYSTLDGSAGRYEGEENGDSYGPEFWPQQPA